MTVDNLKHIRSSKLRKKLEKIFEENRKKQKSYESTPLFKNNNYVAGGAQ